MNTQKVKEIIQLYRRYFKDINTEEIYKWRAVKRFQDNWDIQAQSFLQMLDSSFALAKNLLDSGRYYPKRMLHHYTVKEPETVRQLFIELYREEENLLDRITTFQTSIKTLNLKYFPDRNDYQDLRAILVYLCLRFPDRYYFYKYKMFKEFSRLIDFPYQPSRGDIQNILEYLSLCNIIKAEIVKDNKILELHQARIKEKEYLDGSFNILTQDVIYASVQYIDKFQRGGDQESALKRLIKVDRKVTAKSEKVILKGTFTNYIENERERKRIGDLGELLVLQYEQEKLKMLGIKKEPIHIAKTKGDGLGYDILSYNKKGEEIFIEVKTTIHNYNAPFFITANELEMSKQGKDKYFLYRLYEFDDSNNKAKYYERHGELTGLCSNPVLYRAIIEN